MTTKNKEDLKKLLEDEDEGTSTQEETPGEGEGDTSNESEGDTNTPSDGDEGAPEEETSMVDAFLNGDMDTVKKMIHDKAVDVVKDELEN